MMFAQKENTQASPPGRRLGSEKDAPVPQSRAHQREQPEEPVGCLRGLLIRGARRLPPEFCDNTQASPPGRRLGSEKDAPVPQSRAHQREQPEEPVGCLRGLLIRGARRLPPEFCDVRSPTGCLSIILYERGYSSCIRSIGERVPRPGPQYASDGVSTVERVDAALRKRQ
ncbi:hypothetical protein ACOMHN_028060 [Nucella lapillus]